MQFSITTVLATILAAATATSALAIQPEHIARDTSVAIKTTFSSIFTEEPSIVAEEPKLQKRGPEVELISQMGTEIAKQVGKLALKAAMNLIKDISKWDSARQAFTQAMVKGMMDTNKDPTVVAAACYNKGYKLQNDANIDGKTSVGFKSGLLKTDYDCMFLRAPNAFWTEGDGGFQNLAYQYTNACTFDQKSGDLTCR